ncbi:MAG TPA: ABC transporter ATP-binding protein [Anaerolineales bacterium]|nr:ABC transporter ATP-binding protein [Anaerolineales bacterium]
MIVAKLSNVTRTFKNGAIETKALRGIDLQFEKGEFTALVGPSGSGKTTLLQLIGCLDQPTSGSILINDVEVSGLNRNKRAEIRRGTIGYVFQFFALIPTLNAYENIEMPLLMTGVDPATRKKRVNELLDAVGLGHRAKNRPDQLSGGEQQRVAIARALTTNPSMVLADEPTANLDTNNGEQIMNIIAELNKNTGTTFIFATHDPRVIKYAHRIVTLQDGIIIADVNQ